MVALLSGAKTTCNTGGAMTALRQIILTVIFLILTAGAIRVALTLYYGL